MLKFASGNTVTFTPGIIPLSDPEIVNPFRGSFEWINQTVNPPSWPMMDVFDRFSWRELEPTEGNYDFSKINSLLAQAQFLGGKAGFRIIAACSSCGGIQVPDYLKNLMPKGFCFTYPGPGGQLLYAPDWNDPNFIARADELLQAISSRYANDPHLGFIDASFYGDWAEWHVYQWPYPSSTGATPITSANGHHLIDSMLANFPKQYLLMQHQTVFSGGTPDTDGLLYALGKSARVGIRNDCLGYQWFTDRMSYLYSTYPIIRDRWQTAPLAAEYCHQSAGTGGFTMASGQISTYHVGMISNSNIDPWTSFSSAEQNQFITNNKTAGYRFALTSLTIPATLTPGTTFSVTSTWSNNGVTPAYNPWNVMVQLKNSSGQIVWQGKSGLDLTVPFNTTTPSSKTVTDNFTLPSDIVNGTYTVAIQILDANSYYRPLLLANTGWQSDGSYPLGTITV